jgi:hypothetical protein
VDLYRAQIQGGLLYMIINFSLGDCEEAHPLLTYKIGDHLFEYIPFATSERKGNET